jgi:hypothetical protein
MNVSDAMRCGSRRSTAFEILRGLYLISGVFAAGVGPFGLDTLFRLCISGFAFSFHNTPGEKTEEGSLLAIKNGIMAVTTPTLKCFVMLGIILNVYDVY